MKLTTIILSGSVLVFTACGGGGSSSGSNEETPTSITHNGTTYGFVTSPQTGKVWLDRNLGAAQVCTSFNDTACYGDYYQWGRDFDGHEDSLSATTDTRVSDLNVVGSVFVTSISFPFDWTRADSTGVTRRANWLKTDGTSVCPTGFRVPTIIELRAETLDNGVTDRDAAFASFLKLPSAGYRHPSSAIMTGTGSWGNVWASSVVSANSDYVGFDSAGSGWSSTRRASGFSVRCLKD